MGPADREGQAGEIRLAAGQCEQGADERLDKLPDQAAELCPDYHRDGEIHQVSAQDKFPEATHTG
jgi:hypothetical protein